MKGYMKGHKVWEPIGTKTSKILSSHICEHCPDGTDWAMSGMMPRVFKNFISFPYTYVGHHAPHLQKISYHLFKEAYTRISGKVISSRQVIFTKDTLEDASCFGEATGTHPHQILHISSISNEK
jgi:hypothetical protein